MSHFKRFNEAGDTIVEVLIVLAILSLAFSISSATASKGLLQSRNAQEHSQAQGLLDTQVEQLRTAVNAQINVFQNNVPFCMTSTTTFDSTFASGYNPNATFTNDNFNQYPANCKYASGSFPYYESILYVCGPLCVAGGGATSYFDLRVRWDGQGTLGRQQEEMTYKIQALTPTANSAIVL